MESKRTMEVALNDEQFQSLEYYTGIKNTDKYYATREDAIQYLSAFMTDLEFRELRDMKCIYCVIFHREKLGGNMAHLVK